MKLKDVEVGDYFSFKDDPLGRLNMRTISGWFPLIPRGPHSYKFGYVERGEGSEEREVTLVDLDGEALRAGRRLQLN